MSDQIRQRRRIYSRVTSSTLFHVEDALEMVSKRGDPAPKLRIFTGRYSDSGLDSYVVHYIDLADARPLFDDIAQIHLRPVQWDDYKGSKGKGGAIIANVMSLNTRHYDGADRLFISLTLAPGEKEGRGVVKPIRNRSAIAQINVMLSLDEARKMAYQVQAYLAAYEVCRLWTQLQAEGEKFPPYPLSQRGGNDEAEQGQPSRNGRRDVYGDGTAVPSKDPRTRNVFDLFYDIHSRAPKDGAELGDWWSENKQLYENDV